MFCVGGRPVLVVCLRSRSSAKAETRLMSLKRRAPSGASAEPRLSAARPGDDAGQVTAGRRHDVELEIAVAIRQEGDPAAVGRVAGSEIPAGVVVQHGDVA